MSVVGIIPARLQSTRLPRKLLLNATGRPLIQYTWEAANKAARLNDVIVATDSDEIASVASDFGARCEKTGEHPSGTDRIAEVARRCCQSASIVVNIQGDEPELDPAHIDLLVETLETSTARMATLCTVIRSIDQLHDPSCTKVVVAEDGRALYFSRATIPHARDISEGELLDADSPWRLHVGLYAYRADFLQQLTKLPPSSLEKLEKLEQLRALEAGASIQVAEVDHPAVGIDTVSDYERFVTRMSVAQNKRAAG